MASTLKKSIGILSVMMAATMLVMSTVSVTADAAEWERKGRFKTNRGSEGTWSQRIKREPGKSWRETRRRSDRGESTSTRTRSWDKATRQAETERQVTTSQGRIAKWKSRSTLNEDGSISREGRGTDFRGRDFSGTSRSARNADGSWRTNTTTNSGNGITTERESTLRRLGNGDGLHSSGTYQRSDGGSGTFERTRSRTESGYQNQSQIESASGKTFGRDVEYQRDGSTVNRSVTLTGPDGQSHTRTGSVTLDPK